MINYYHSRKYGINEFFFDKWTPKMAYVLGFWFADGYMRKEKSYRITFSSKDEEILLQIRNAMKSTHPIRIDREEYYHISLCSKHLYEALVKLGGHRKKSKTISFPSIPNILLRDFIRGYFDGDGSVFFVNYLRTKDGKRTRELRTNFTSGSKGFLQKLMMVLNREISLPQNKKLGVFNGGSSLKLGYAMKDSDALLHYMYYDKFPIGLKRKADYVDKIPQYQTHTMK